MVICITFVFENNIQEKLKINASQYDSLIENNYSKIDQVLLLPQPGNNIGQVCTSLWRMIYLNFALKTKRNILPYPSHVHIIEITDIYWNAPF